MGSKLSNNVRRHLAMAHIVECRIVDNVILAPSPQQGQEVQPCLRAARAEHAEPAAARAPVSSTLIQGAGARPARRIV